LDLLKLTSKANVNKLAQPLNAAEATVAFAPMLCVLFIGARMRALQLDPKNGNPQEWAQNCFYMCTYAVLAQLLLVLILPFVLEGEVKANEAVEGDIIFEFKNQTAGAAVTAGRYAIMLAMYGGFTAVIISVMTIEAKDGAPTPPVSPAMQCVMNLTTQFFAVYLAIQVISTLKTFSAGEGSGLNTALKVGNACKDTVEFCPMLCVLFIGLRLRALQITDQKGSPQGYAQQAMFLGTYAVLVQLVMIIFEAVMKGLSEKENNYVAYATQTIRYVALLCLYGGAITCCVAVFRITPETANGSGGLIPGVEVPAPGF